jgi:hypothetical protein
MTIRDEHNSEWLTRKRRIDPVVNGLGWNLRAAGSGAFRLEEYETANGPRFNVMFQRIYRDDEKGWRSTDSFGRDDLLVLAKVAEQAHGRIVALNQPQLRQE